MKDSLFDLVLENLVNKHHDMLKKAQAIIDSVDDDMYLNIFPAMIYSRFFPEDYTEKDFANIIDNRMDVIVIAVENVDEHPVFVGMDFLKDGQLSVWTWTTKDIDDISKFHIGVDAFDAFLSSKDGAAFKTFLIETDTTISFSCLDVGIIPSKDKKTGDLYSKVRIIGGGKINA